ncbi:hypothetical protein P7C73_g3757, partial [Tremellales sp. Uapishka_1]
MSVTELNRLVRLFEGDDIFKPTGRKPMAPPKYQLGLMVYRLAHGEKLKHIALTFGIYVGAVYEWTNRSVRAIVRQRDRFIVWHLQVQRMEITTSFQDAYDIPDCVGIIDGFTSISTKPRHKTMRERSTVVRSDTD